MSDAENQGDAQETPKPVSTPTPAEQDRINAAAAKNRRNMQRELAEARQKAQAFEALQGQVSELLESGIIDGVEDLSDFREAAANTLSQFRSEKEILERNQKAMERKLSQAQREAEESKARFERAMIERTIMDEASDLVVDGPGREGAVEYFQLKLGQLAEFNHATGEVGVKWKVTDEETGRTEDRIIPVKAALKDMEANPTKYGRYFRSTVNGGSGGETVDGVQRTSDGGLDFANMDFNKFKELATKNPALLEQAAEKLVF